MPGRDRSRRSASSRGQPDGALERGRDLGGPHHGAGPGRVDVHPQPLPGRDHPERSRPTAAPRRRARRPAPGARSPNRWTSCRKPPNASWPVTFCSMIAGTSASITRPVRHDPPVRPAPVRVGEHRVGRREAGRVVVGAEHRRHARRAPSRRRRPRPCACTSPSAGRARSRSVAVPSGVRMPRQIVPSGSVRNVGSAPPLRRIDSVVPTAQGQSGRHTRSVPLASRRTEYVGAVGQNERRAARTTW